MILHTVHTKAVVALQGEEIGFFVRIKANVALGSPHCHWNQSEKLFDFNWSRDYRKRGEIVTKVIIKQIVVKTASSKRSVVKLIENFVGVHNMLIISRIH